MSLFSLLFEPMIEVYDYDPEWVLKFEKLKSKLWEAVSSVAKSIEHVGSTSVVGLAAKPVIDVDIIINSKEDLPKINSALEPLGYYHVGDLGIVGREMFKHANPEFKHNLYVCIDGCLSLKNHLVLRDHLRSHSKDAEQYGSLKKSLAKKFPDDIDSYVEGKTSFILSILGQYEICDNSLENIQLANKKSGIIRLASLGEEENLSALAVRSKGYWAYDKKFIEDCRDDLKLDSEYIKNEMVYVCEQDDKIVGYYGFCETEGSLEMICLFVEPDFIEKGIGYKLWEHSKGFAKEKGWSKFKIVADPYAAEKFYLKVGCVQVGEHESPVREVRVLPVLEFIL